MLLMGDYHKRIKMLVKCTACKGQKRIICLGFIEGDCKACEGTGFMHLDQAINEEPKKRMRKAKPSLVASFVEPHQTSSQSNEPSSSNP